jgi:hypothetical protein
MKELEFLGQVVYEWRGFAEARRGGLEDFEMGDSHGGTGHGNM